MLYAAAVEQVKINPEKPVSPSHAWGWPALIASVAAAGVALFVSTSIYRSRANTYDRQLAVARQTVDQLSLELAQTQLEAKAAGRNIARLHEFAGVLRATDAALIPVDVPAAAGGWGRGMLDKSTGRLHVYLAELTALAGKDCVLRAVTDAGKVELATVKLDAHGAAISSDLSAPAGLKRLELVALPTMGDTPILP